MRYETVIFDLDGTLLDTLEDLADSVNHVLKESGYPERTLGEVRDFVGNGIRKLIERSVPEGTTVDSIDKVHQHFIAYYKEHCMEKTKPYDGISDLLQSLRKAGCKIAVVSNKADYAVQLLCKKYFNGMFDAALGELTGTPKKPAPDSVLHVLKKLDTESSKAVYVGDSDVDILTARNCCMDEIIVTWGFRDKKFLEEQGAKVFASSPEEILDIVMEK